MKELENLLQAVREERLTYEDAGRKLIEFIYKNKQWFGLNKMKEDELHDFLLEKYSLFTRIFINFDSSKGDFLGYLIGNVIQAYQGWKRETARLMVKRKTLEEIEFLRVQAEEKSELIEDSLYVSDFFQDHDHAVEEIKRIASYHKQYISRNEMTFKDKSIETIRQEGILILMVKSWYLIDPELLDKISAITQIQTSILMEILDKTKKLMRKKIDKVNFILKQRNISYYFKELYQIEGRLQYGMNLSYLINRKQNYHSGRWNRFNRELQDQNRKLVPSHRIVGLVLGMNPNRIQYVLRKINRNMDIISLNCYYGRHEDLLGKRKFE